MFNFLYCGFGSVLGGLLTALLISGGILAFSTQHTKRGGIEPIPLVLCAILFCFLFYQITLIYAAFSSKSVAMDFITACHLQFGGNIDGAELKEQMITLIRENPLISFFIDYSGLEDFDWSQPIQSFREVIAREYNWYIFCRIVWSIVFISIAIGGIIIFGGKRRKATMCRRSYREEDDIFNFD